MNFFSHLRFTYSIITNFTGSLSKEYFDGVNMIKFADCNKSTGCFFEPVP